MLLTYYTYLGPLTLVSPHQLLLWSSKMTKIYSLLYLLAIFFLLLRYWHWTLICHLWGQGEYCKYFHWFLLWEGRDFTWTCSKASPSYHLRSTSSAITVHCHWCLVTISLFLYVLYFSCVLLHFSILHQQQFFIIPLCSFLFLRIQKCNVEETFTNEF